MLNAHATALYYAFHFTYAFFTLKKNNKKTRMQIKNKTTRKYLPLTEWIIKAPRLESVGKIMLLQSKTSAKKYTSHSKLPYTKRK